MVIHSAPTKISTILLPGGSFPSLSVPLSLLSLSGGHKRWSSVFKSGTVRPGLQCVCVRGERKKKKKGGGKERKGRMGVTGEGY